MMKQLLTFQVKSSGIATRKALTNQRYCCATAEYTPSGTMCDYKNATREESGSDARNYHECIFGVLVTVFPLVCFISLILQISLSIFVFKAPSKIILSFSYSLFHSHCLSIISFWWFILCIYLFLVDWISSCWCFRFCVLWCVLLLFVMCFI